MAKLGYLYLNGGIWNGERVLNETWTRASTEAFTDVQNPAMAEFWGDRYGYHWWLRNYQTPLGPVEVFLRTGWGGQAIIAFPSLDMIVVFTGGNYATDNYMQPLHEIVSQYILPALN
jgi:CubicO group peptidase (beta-lactamase class C family)